MLVVINGMLWIVSVEATVRESLTDFSRQRRQIVFTCAKICQLWQVPRHTHTQTYFQTTSLGKREDTSLNNAYVMQTDHTS